jgi:hypothetical protein
MQLESVFASDVRCDARTPRVAPDARGAFGTVYHSPCVTASAVAPQTHEIVCGLRREQFGLELDTMRML